MKLLSYLGAFLSPDTFRFQLQDLNQNHQHLTLNQLKHQYQTIYQIYEQLPLYHQKQLHALITQFQEIISQQIQTNQQIQTLLTNFPQSNLKKQAQTYHQINQLHQSLTYPQQKQHLPQIINLREQLERKL